ncbi:hypothetical protein NPX13_g11414 [Xylaria arbuscula]|uniref:Uncharacterized protein n=1 Tax=Xylaria arbuscula TaxID=114810 RepID=A0A9W8N2T3_9PEZI|nr:hypothetical protein NPX13_g11414 [Xylaria arbuscula]
MQIPYVRRNILKSLGQPQVRLRAVCLYILDHDRVRRGRRLGQLVIVGVSDIQILSRSRRNSSARGGAFGAAESHRAKVRQTDLATVHDEIFNDPLDRRAAQGERVGNRRAVALSRGLV